MTVAAAAAAMLRAAATMTAIMTLFLVSTQQAEAEDTPSPNDAIPKPECDANATAVLRYSSSSERLYLESADGVTRGGCITLTEIWQQLAGSVPLFAVESESGNVSRTATGTWLLTETLYVEDGITLQVGERWWFRRGVLWRALCVDAFVCAWGDLLRACVLSSMCPVLLIATKDVYGRELLCAFHGVYVC